jgi:hypothetical protein
MSEGRRLDVPRDDPLVRVAIAQSEIEAEMLNERLKSIGVESLVRIDDDVRASTRAFGGLSWAYPVFVLESDADRAQTFLSDIGGTTEPKSERRIHRAETLAGSLVTIGITLILMLALLARDL